MKVTLVQCTNVKRDTQSRACDLYDESTYFNKQRTYAEATADRWFIQSAKYGLVHPTRLIGPYDTRAEDLDNPDRWAEGIADRLMGRFDRDATIEILGGKHYAGPLRTQLLKWNMDVETPLEGKKSVNEWRGWTNTHDPRVRRVKYPDQLPIQTPKAIYRM